MSRAMSEAEFQRQVEELCKYRHLLYYHVTRTDKRDQPGFPDLVIVGSRVVFAELKTEKGKMSPRQDEWAFALRNAGAEHYLWRPSDLPEINKVLTSLMVRV